MPSIIIAGAGAAGLSFAYYLSRHGSDTDFTCTIVDPDSKRENDRTWAFWGGPFDFDHLVEHHWNQVTLSQDGATVVRDSAGYRFIPADRFYRYCLEQLEGDPRFTFVRGRVEQIIRYDSRVAVSVRDLNTPADAPARQGEPAWPGQPERQGYREIEGDYVFESIFGPSQAQASITGSPDGGGRAARRQAVPPRDFRGPDYPLRQAFVGWEVNTISPQWEPSVATLMEFPEDSGDDRFEFFYVLPSDCSHALIEYTTVSEHVPSDDYLEARLEAYLDDRVGAGNWSLTRREKGTIPLYEDIAPDVDDRVIRLGVVNGAARPSTGYAFRAITESSKALAQAFLAGHGFSLSGGRPAHVRGRPRFYDRVFLELLRREPAELPGALVQMFRGNHGETVFRFLEGRSRLRDEVRIVWSLPWGPFLRALFRLWTRAIAWRPMRQPEERARQTEERVVRSQV